MTKIVSKMWVIGALMVISTTIIIVATIQMNSKDRQDGIVINVAGKERMLSQFITKEIFMVLYDKNRGYEELDKAIFEFEGSLGDLENGNEKRGIYKAPTQEIVSAINEVKKEWYAYKENIRWIKEGGNTPKVHIEYITQNNTVLLEKIDTVVSLFTEYSKKQRELLQSFQFSAGFVVFMIVIYSIMVVMGIKEHFDEFLQKSKELANINLESQEEIKLYVSGDDELSEAGNNINSFIQKINRAIEGSNEARRVSESIAEEVSKLNDELNKKMAELNMDDETKKSLKKEIDKTEDIAIQSGEGLINYARMLQKIRDSLDRINGKIA